MGVLRHASVGVVACVGIASGCRSGSFACADDTQCAGTGAIGFCEDSGYCSFDDDACPSGRRYGVRAPSELADECVPPGPATGATTVDDAASDETTTTVTDTSASSLSATMPVDPDTGDDATSDHATGIGPTSDAPTSTGGDTGSTGTPVDDTGSTTGPPPPPCTPAFVDDFEDGVLDPEWDTWNSAECSFTEVGGRLEMSIGASSVEWVSAGIYTQPHSFVGGLVRAELVPFDPPLEVVGVWLTIFDAADCEIQIAAENSLVHGMSAGVWFDGVAVDTESPIWLQLRVDDDGLTHWEWSSDGELWTEVHSEVPPCDFSSAQSALFAGDMHDLAPVVRAVESYERCEAP